MKYMLALAALFSAFSAQADTTFSNASASLAPKEKPFVLTDHFTMDMTVYYYGASVTAQGSPFQPTADGYDNPEAPVKFQTRFRPQWKFAPDWTIGPVVEWNYMPVQGGDYNFGNIFLRVVKNNLIKTDQLGAMGEIRIYMPTTEAAQDKDMIFSARAYHDAWYGFKGTKLSLGLEQYIRGWVYGSDNKAGEPLVEWWWGPYINYDISPKFAIKGQIDGNFYSAVEKEGEALNDPTHIRLGIGWMVTDNILLAPHIYTPVTNFSWSASVVNLEAWAKIF